MSYVPNKGTYDVAVVRTAFFYGYKKARKFFKKLKGIYSTCHTPPLKTAKKQGEKCQYSSSVPSIHRIIVV